MGARLWLPDRGMMSYQHGIFSVAVIWDSCEKLIS